MPPSVVVTIGEVARCSRRHSEDHVCAVFDGGERFARDGVSRAQVSAHKGADTLPDECGRTIHIFSAADAEHFAVCRALRVEPLVGDGESELCVCESAMEGSTG